MKRVIRWVLSIVYVSIGYSLIFGLLVFKAATPLPSDLAYDASLMNTPSDETAYAYLVEERLWSFDVRLSLINAAETTLDICVYAIHDGESLDIFYGALLEAAERGVKVRMIADALIEGKISADKERLRALESHPNIDYKFYEPVNLLRPYTLQNRLHDKFIIVDDQYALLSGRNLGDRYFMDRDDSANMVKDRDVLIFGEDKLQAITDMQAYFDELFAHEFTQPGNYQMNNKSSETRTMLQHAYLEFISDLDLNAILQTIEDDAYFVERITFMRSPLTRLLKDPVILETLVNLAQDYEDLFVQTPYLVVSPPMAKIFEPLIGKNIHVLTNSPAVNPNYFGAAGYTRYRNHYLDDLTLYEYQGPLSLHHKTILFGDDISAIGTLNIDPRSAYLSTESMLVIYSEPFNAHVKETIAMYLERSLEVGQDGNLIPDDSVTPAENTWIHHAIITLVRVITYWFEEML